MISEKNLGPQVAKDRFKSAPWKQTNSVVFLTY